MHAKSLLLRPFRSFILLRPPILPILSLLSLLLILPILFTSALHAASFISLGERAKYQNLAHFDYVNPAAKKGGELKSYVLGSFSSLNAFSLTESAAAGLELVYDTLMAQSMDEPYAQYALVACDVEFRERSVVFTIDPRARFSDGVKISAEDVGFSFDMMVQNPLYKQYYADVLGYKVLDSRRIEFLFATSENKELPLILGQLSVLPKHYYVKDGQNSFGRDALKLPLGSGAYKLTRFEVGKSLTYERDPNYWARDLPSRVGQFNFDTMRYEYYRDDTAALQAFLAHKYDWRIESAAKVWARGYGGKALDSGKFAMMSIEHSLPSGMQGFFLNMRKPLLDDPQIRRALVLAFNFEWSNENLFFSQYARTTSFFNHSIFAYNAPNPESGAESGAKFSKDSSPKPLGQSQILRSCGASEQHIAALAQPYILPSMPDPATERQSLKHARDLLTRAGVSIEQSQAYKGTKPLRFTLLLDNPAFERLAIRYARNLKLLGIALEIQKIDHNQYENRVKNFDYDMIVGVIPQSLSPGNEQRYFFGSSAARTQGSKNYSGVESKLVDCLIERLISSRTHSELVAHTRALDRVLLGLDMVVPHYFLPSFRLAIWENVGMPETPPRYDISPTLWWDKALQ